LLLPLWAQVAAGAPSHPYLYFSKSDIPALRARMESEPFAGRWERFLAHADRCLKRPVPSPGQARGSSRNSLGVAGTTAFAYVITRERQYGLRAKAELVALLESERWHNPVHWNKGADLKTAELSAAAALVWDWCYDSMTPDERRAIREGILEKSTRVYLSSVEEHHDWWVDSPVNNWCGVCHGGCGLAALALYHESPEAERAANLAWQHVQKFLRTVILQDGGGHEGIMYWRYGVGFGNYLATAAARCDEMGGDGGLFQTYTNKLAGYWDIYMQGPDMRYANFNDMNEDTFAGLYGEDHRRWQGGPNSDLCALFESRVPGGDPFLLWGADNGGSAFYWAGISPFYFLWRRGAPPAGQKPPLQDAVLFRGAGHAIFQSPGLWFVYNGGWTRKGGHQNKDLGTYVLVAGGERFVSDPGYGAGRTQDHSTVLVNGQGQPRGVRGRYHRFGTGDGFAYLASDLSDCYPETGLKRFVRHALMVRGEYIVLIDDLAAEGSPRFEWQMHSAQPSRAEPGGRLVTVRGSKVDLHVVVASPEDARVSAEQTSIKMKRDSQDMHTTRIVPGSPREQDLIVTVLYPVNSGGPAPRVALDGRGILTVQSGSDTDTIALGKADFGAVVTSVNGKSTARLPSPQARTLRPFR
jgi:hypothetical protein